LFGYWLTYSRVAIADKYGEDTTAKAVSTRFERLKKEPDWLGNDGVSRTNNKIAGPKSTPRKTNKPKKSAAGKGNSEEGDNNSDDEELENTPTKAKGLLNKTQGGRVTKTQSPKKSFNGSFNGNGAATHPYDLDINQADPYAVKQESRTDAQFDNNGSYPNFGYHENGNEIAMEEERFYDPHESYLTEA
jgi:hypothetical protein